MLIGSCQANDDLDKFKELTDVQWTTTPAELISAFRSDVNVIWFGSVERRVIYTNQSGTTSVMWLCAHHAFVEPSPSSIGEPFEVEAQVTGHFVLSLELPETSEEGATTMLDQMKSPAWALISGQPSMVGEFAGGVPAVMVLPGYSMISDEWKVNLR